MIAPQQDSKMAPRNAPARATAVRCRRLTRTEINAPARSDGGGTGMTVVTPYPSFCAP